jgi:CRP-like cAMP-binding protein
MNDAFQKDNEKDVCRSYQATELHNYQSGDEIVREGEVCPCFYVILSGQVKVIKQGRFVRLLEDQDVFGLESVLLKQPMPYTARVKTTSRIASYGPAALDHFFSENPRMVQSILNSTLDQLMQTTDNLVQSTGTFRLEDAQVDFYSDGEIIVEEGTPETDLFRLVSTQGGLKVSRAGEEIARIDKPGEFFGEMAGLLDLPRQATITSIGESVIERYGFEDLEMIIRDYPEVALHIVRTLVTRLMELHKKYTEVI